MKSLKIKKGDSVKVIAGNDKGAIGEVLSVDPARERVVVEGVNIRKHHRRDMPPHRAAPLRAASSRLRLRSTFRTFSS